ncbi:efflux RND transporter periplasmic adaptor subunit [Shewanella gelidii]|uniref:MexH family multidrug efflux RND transporter periplasmic adaptor subunit n=1 Tax=Shewanella gelidii TaxID=1642821 RepID=A0A917ND15_9GAMM|nr:efflux RND transporter periplasmic adaptor subunit [Shewanella gelidii]MCL1099074.1 efflux RND transporter periplasmic adaptor subunit [Shewanella gelidii]GGI88378.1 MexH family multidrug efflux RND transporter periplasmic adaptor subunit [Shewanella gelidii]
MKKIVLLLVIVAAAGFAYMQTSTTQKKQVHRNKPLPNVVVTKTAMASVRDEVEALGTTKANESVTITPKVTEIVTALNFEDGDLVNKGDVLIQLHNVEPAAKVKVARVKVVENLREFDRISSLVTSQTIAELERDRLQTQIDTARAELEQAESSLADRSISAPFSGRLGLRQVSVGSLVTPGTSITTLDDISTIKLDFSVPERFLQQLSRGKLVEASAVAYGGEVFKGKVSSIDSRVNPETRSVIVRAAIPNPKGRLLPGMLMKVKLIKQSREALLIPESSIIPIQKKHFVYIANEEGVIEQKQVEIGLRSRGWVEITDGLELGEQVLIRGILKVRPGSKVQVQLEENFTFKTQAKTEIAA